MSIPVILIQIQHLLKLNFKIRSLFFLLIYSNTTLVKVKSYPALHFLHYMCHSNTTLVKVKFLG